MTITNGQRVMTRPGVGTRKRPAPRSAAAPIAIVGPPAGQRVTERPGAFGPAEVVALQRAVGNQATLRLIGGGDRSPRPRVQRDLTENQKGYAALKNLGLGTHRPASPPDRASQAKEALGYGATAIGTPGAAVGGFGGAVVVDDPYAKKPETLAEVGNADTRNELKTAAASMGVGTDVLALGGNVAAIFMLSKKLKTAKGWEKRKTELDLGEQVGGATSKGGKILAGIPKTIAQGVVTADSKNEAAKQTAYITSGYTEMFSAVGAGFQTVTRGAKGIMGIIRVVQGKAGSKKKSALVEAITDLFESGKAFLSTINGVIGTIQWFLRAAQVAGDFIQAVPFIGGAISICTQAIDILVQGIKAITQLVKMAGSWLKTQAMERMRGDVSAGPTADQTMFQYLADINRKRFRRAIIPLIAAATTIIADIYSIGASVLNMAGTATAGAMGAGGALLAAGYGVAAGAGVMKLGAASLKPAAWAVRTSKQGLRDMAGKSGSTHPVGKRVTKALNKKPFGKRLFNTDKTTQKKDQARNDAVDTLLTHIMALPDEQTINAIQDQNNRAAAIVQVWQVERMIEATGVDPETLAAAEDQEDVKAKLRAAMKQRD